ncbi:MAG: hypothetical protein ACLTCQ_05975 [Enterocloster bolteae]
MDNEYTVIGKPRPIGDAALKVTGQKIYVGDMELPGMLLRKGALKHGSPCQNKEHRHLRG